MRVLSYLEIENRSFFAFSSNHFDSGRPVSHTRHVSRDLIEAILSTNVPVCGEAHRGRSEKAFALKEEGDRQGAGLSKLGKNCCVTEATIPYLSWRASVKGFTFHARISTE